MIMKSIRTASILLPVTALLFLLITIASGAAHADTRENPMEVKEKQEFTPCAEDIITRLDFSGGAFIPAGVLADGMDAGWSFIINIRTPFLHLVPLTAPGGFVSVMRQFEMGLHFSYIAGRNPENSSNEIAFAPILLDVYYTIPLNLKGFAFYVYNGLGASLASTVVDRDQGSGHRQSIDFALRPGAGCEYYFTDSVYMRLNVGYFVCFESETGMGTVASLGAGYAY